MESIVESVCKRLRIAEDATLEGFASAVKRGGRWGWGQKPATQARREVERKGGGGESAIGKRVVKEIEPETLSGKTLKRGAGENAKTASVLQQVGMKF